MRLMIFLFCVFSFIQSFSQELNRNSTDIFPHDKLQSGSQNMSVDVLLDHEGILWLATYSGLVKWDGYHKKKFNRNMPDGNYLDGTQLRRIFALDSTSIVIQSQDRQSTLSILKRGERIARTIPFVDLKKDDLNPNIKFVFQSSEDEIYVATSNLNSLNIYKLIKEKFVLQSTITFDFDIEEKFIQITQFREDFWIGIEGQGVWKSSNNNKTLVYKFENRMHNASRTLSFLYADRESRLWMLLNSEENIWLWDNDLAEFVIYDSPSDNIVNLIEEDNSGNLLFISGVYPYPLVSAHLLADTTWIDYTSQINPDIISVHPTQDFTSSMLGVNSDNVQIINTKSNKVKSILQTKLEPGASFGNIIKGINEDKEGNMYFLEEIDGFYRMDIATKEITSIRLEDEKGQVLKFRCGGAIHTDLDHNFWFKICDENTKGRLVKYNPQTGATEYFFMEDLIRDIDIDSNGKIWIVAHNRANRNGKLYYFDEESQQIVNLILHDQNDNNVFAEPRFIFTAKDSMIWVGTIRGLVQIDVSANTLKIFTKENSKLTNDLIITIEQDIKGKLLLGTHGGGVQIFDPINGNNKTYTEEDGLVDNYVCGILTIDDHRYWLSTFNGLSYWDTLDSNFTNFKKEEGIENTEFNRYAYYTSSAGSHYFGNVNGVNYFKTEDMIAFDNPPRLALAKVSKYYGKADTFEIQVKGLDELETIALDPNVTFLELDFIAYDFKGGKSSKIMTFLEGYDDDWQRVGPDGKVRYRLLPAGKYRLEVKGSSPLGVPSVNNIAILIESKQHFYNTGFFFISILIAVGLLSYYFAKKQIDQVKLEESNKQKVKQKIASLELKALQAQLNPHFIFNALGAIQYYIQVNDKESADIYLTKFAQLMRRYLDSSKEKLISLHSEIELLQIYSELEQLRFDSKFNIEFVVSRDLELEEIFIPSMMIQPFLENAINHGLSARNDSGGKVTIGFSKKNRSLVCEVKDNGIGRKNAKKFIRKGHKSRGMSILDEKIQTMKISNIVDVELNISDWNKQSKDYPGTIVEIVFVNLLGNEDQL